MNKLTDKQKKDYVKKSWGKCPKCHSSDISGAEITVECMLGQKAVQEVDCNACNFSWVDIYTLSDVEENELTTF